MTGTFTIAAGSHYCRPRYPYLFYGSEMSRVVRFDRSCQYSGELDAKGPINKLFGFGELWPSVLDHQWGRPLHHLASARFGWNCDSLRNIWLYGYSYADGVRETVRICRVPVDDFIECHIKLTPDQYVFKVHYDVFIEVGKDSYETFTRKLKRGPSGSRAFGFGLFPYHGGTNPAPHNMSISLSRP